MVNIESGSSGIYIEILKLKLPIQLQYSISDIDELLDNVFDPLSGQAK
jgi:hypothetical protein